MLRKTGLWHDTRELPDSLAATLDARDGVAETASLLGAKGVRRIIASGNGAAYYVAMALWLASLASSSGPEELAEPRGLLARGEIRWRPGDAFLADSSLGQFITL